METESDRVSQALADGFTDESRCNNAGLQARCYVQPRSGEGLGLGESRKEKIKDGHEKNGGAELSWFGAEVGEFGGSNECGFGG
ncbi:hypothetical protein Tco_1340505 [Tanacetum coccineum]